MSFWSKYGQNLSEFGKRIEKSGHFVSFESDLAFKKVEKSASFATF